MTKALHWYRALPDSDIAAAVLVFALCVGNVAYECYDFYQLFQPFPINL